MLPKLLIAWCLMALCVAIHATGLMHALRWINRRSGLAEAPVGRSTWILIRVAGWTVLLHLLEITIWAAFYALRGAMPDFTAAAYFSAVTYTTTGYGDLVLSEEWRLVGGVEALTGILMCGLSTGMFFAVFSRSFDPTGPQAPSKQ